MHLRFRITTPRLRDAHGAPPKVEDVDDPHYHDKKEDPHEQEQGKNPVEVIEGGEEGGPTQPEDDNQRQRGKREGLTPLLQRSQHETVREEDYSPPDINDEDDQAEEPLEGADDTGGEGQGAEKQAPHGIGVLQDQEKPGCDK